MSSILGGVSSGWLLMQLFLDIDFEGLHAENNLCLSCVLFPPMFIENENDERVRVTFSQKKKCFLMML